MNGLAFGKQASGSARHGTWIDAIRAGESAAPDGLRGLLGRGQDSPTRGNQPHLPQSYIKLADNSQGK